MCDGPIEKSGNDSASEFSYFSFYLLDDFYCMEMFISSEMAEKFRCNGSS